MTDLRYQATLYPNNSLSPQGFRILICLLGGVFFAIGLLFFSMGAWPVSGLLGLDLLLVYLAFQYNFRDNRLREHVQVDHTNIQVRRIAPSGRAQEWVFNSYWARIEKEYDEYRSCIALKLTSHGKSVRIATFLLPEEREQLADELSMHLGPHRSNTVQ